MNGTEIRAALTQLEIYFSGPQEQVTAQDALDECAILRREFEPPGFNPSKGREGEPILTGWEAEMAEARKIVDGMKRAVLMHDFEAGLAKSKELRAICDEILPLPRAPKPADKGGK